MKEKLIHFIKIITWQEYRDLKAEWEKQNADLDKMHAERDKYKKAFNDLTMEHELEKDQFGNKLIRLERKHEKEIENYTERMEGIIEALRMDNETLEKALKREKDKLAKKEQQRRKAVGEKTAAVKKISALEEQVNFLKTHRRAPDLEEIKDYTYGRKRKKCSKK